MWRLALLTLAALLWTGAGRATPPASVTLAWTRADPSCIDAPALAASVERTLGRAVFHGDAPARATIAGTAHAVDSGGYAAAISLLAADGTKLAERALTTAGDCRRLDESIAVVVSVMVDSLEPAASPLAIPPRPVTPAPAPSPLETVATNAAPAPPRTSPGIALGFGAGVSGGIVPATAPLALMRAEVAPTAFLPVALTLRGVAPSDARVASAGGQFYAWSAELAVCPTATVGVGLWLRLGVCAGGGGGAIHGSPVGLSGGHASDAPTFFAVAAPSAAARLAGPLWLRAEAGVSVLFLRSPWGYLGASGNYVQVYEPGIIAPFASLAVELRVDP